jgi:chromosome segregation and condensation protein ScpB
MIDFERQLVVRQRMQERLQEAENERMARMARRKPVGRPEVRPMRGRIAIAIVRRLARMAQAS